MKNTKHMFMRVASLALITSLSLSMTALADWKQEGSAWKYQNSDGSFSTSSWQWINGKCYCFDSNGVMYANTTTPDGYTVNADGAWTVNGVVQVKNNDVNVTAYSDNEQYPLAHLKDWFVFTNNGTLATKYSANYLWEQNPALENTWNDKYGYNGLVDYQRSKAAEAHNIFYSVAGYTAGESLYAVARLAGVSMPGAHAIESSDKTIALEKEIRSFLNSFDWKNASDLEKAIHIAQRVNKAEYDDSTESCNLAYGCLVEGKAVCDGYTDAASLLAWCVDLQSTIVTSLAANHSYMAYCIDGVWVSHEATSHDESFKIVDPTVGIQHIGSFTRYGWLADYCDRTGYTIPSNAEILQKFPNNARVIDNLGRIVIYFN